MTDQERGTGKRGPYRKSAELRRQILEAALKVFARDGYRAGSIRDIAEVAGVTAPTLLHHFGSKSALLLEALRYREHLDRSFTDDVEPGTAGALLVAVDLVERNTRQRGLAELFCVLSAEATSEAHPAHAYFKERYGWLRDMFAVGFARLAEAGRLRPGVDPVLAARDTIALMDGLQLQWLLDPEAVDMTAALTRHLQGLITEREWARAVARRNGRPDAGSPPAAHDDAPATAHDDAPATRGGRVATIQDIAERTGVSTASVSRALNGKPGVSAATRDLVVAAAAELGFTASPAARALKTGRTGRVVVTMPRLDSPYPARLLGGVAQVLEERGLNLALGTTQVFHGNVRPVLERHGRHGFDGVILILPFGTAKDFVAPATAGKPIVAVEPLCALDIPSVGIDNARGARQAVAHLAELGHRRIGILTGEEGSPATRDRLAGARATLAEAGVWDESLVRTCAFLDPAGSVAATLSLLASERPPTALFAMNDRLASGAYQAAASLGLDIPRDLSVVGFNDDQVAVSLTPPLTTVHQPLEQIGATAARLLLDRLDGIDDGRLRIELPTRFVRRDSTCPPGGA